MANAMIYNLVVSHIPQHHTIANQTQLSEKTFTKIFGSQKHKILNVIMKCSVRTIHTNVQIQEKYTIETLFNHNIFTEFILISVQCA